MITVVGSIHRDLVSVVPHLPKPGETVIGGDLAAVPGGKGANQAVAAARAGAGVRFVGAVGSDEAGRAMRSVLAEEGIDVDAVRVIDGASTGAALIAVDRRGANQIVVSSGANRRLDAAAIADSREALLGARVVVLQLEIPIEAVVRAIDVARAGRATIVLNAAPATRLPPDVLRAVDVLVANELEAGSLLADDSGATAELAERLSAKLESTLVVVTAGSRGAYFARSGGDPVHVPPLRVQSVDATGAGDTFVGVLSAELDRGTKLAAAMRFASAAAALSTTRPGAIPSIPTRTETGSLLESAD